ncbi:MAG: YkgJ family cysteine cluster protein [Verrucomicrobiales bacterium]|nr:YkgJ family cysteine cluster protein [Verrucomicrobiales bacterium]
MPTYYECRRCTACCRWPGEVRLSDDEVDRIAGYLGMEARDFVERYTALRKDRTGLTLRERGDGACVFLEGMDCRIQAVKPVQCREFPNGWNFPGFEAICRAVAREVTVEEYDRLRGSGGA